MDNHFIKGNAKGAGEIKHTSRIALECRFRTMIADKRLSNSVEFLTGDSGFYVGGNFSDRIANQQAILPEDLYFFFGLVVKLWANV
jgi:hypothetical protein